MLLLGIKCGWRLVADGVIDGTELHGFRRHTFGGCALENVSCRHSSMPCRCDPSMICTGIRRHLSTYISLDLLMPPSSTDTQNRIRQQYVG